MAIERLGRTVRLTTDDAESDDFTEWWDAIDLPEASVEEMELTRTATAISSTDSRLDADQGWGILEWLHDALNTNQAADLFRIGFKWDSTNESQERWMPQGISGTADAYDDGDLGGRKFLVAAWYFDDDGEVDDLGARVSFVDVTDWGEELPYRHALLVRPALSGGHHTFEIASTHAGGIVWYKRYLYVASGKELLVFDTHRMRAIRGDQDDLDQDEDDFRIGHVDGRFAALGYRYVIPLVRVYAVEEDEEAGGVFSTLSLDRESDPPRLVAAKYISDDENDPPDGDGDTDFDHDLDHSVVLFFPLGSDGAIDGWETGTVESDESWLSNLRFVQGVFAKGDSIWFCQSTGDNQFLRRRSKSGAQGERFEWATGGESLHYSKATDHLWNLTEFEDRRVVFCVLLDSVS